MHIQEIRFSKRAWLKAFLEDDFGSGKRAAMIVVPGGAYLTKTKREKDPIALQFLMLNYQTFVLNYSTLWEKNFVKENEPIVCNEPAPYPQQVYELLEAISFLKDHSEEYGIDSEKIFVIGLSAGGHIAASAGIYWNNPDFLVKIHKSPEEVRPSGLILAYPQLSADPLFQLLKHPPNDVMKITAPYMIESAFGKREVSDQEHSFFNLSGKVTTDFPPAFVWHTVPDEITPSLATTSFVKELQEKGIACEYLLFSEGHHGMGLATPYVAAGEGDYLKKNALWPVLADLFLRSL